MSVVHIPGAQGASPDKASVEKMLAENSQLIEAIAEYQRMGKIDDAMSYQELLQRNLIYLGNLVDASLVQQIQDPRNVSPRSQSQPSSNGTSGPINGHSPYNTQVSTHPQNASTPPMVNGQALYPPNTNPNSNYYGDPNQQQYGAPPTQSLSPYSNVHQQNPPQNYPIQPQNR